MPHWIERLFWKMCVFWNSHPAFLFPLIQVFNYSWRVYIESILLLAHHLWVMIRLVLLLLLPSLICLGGPWFLGCGFLFIFQAEIPAPALALEVFPSRHAPSVYSVHCFCDMCVSCALVFEVFVLPFQACFRKILIAFSGVSLLCYVWIIQGWDISNFFVGIPSPHEQWQPSQIRSRWVAEMNNIIKFWICENLK